ncbi:MAG: hypothetical protein H0V49_12865 [Nocardioidaceae bacterium]|nr:hypothetical protein [Nocardioidaceae bacterium]
MAKPAGSDRDEALRRRHRDAVFGDVLPDSTRDERGEGGAGGEPGGDSDVAARERDLLRDVPPHHG